MQELSRYLLGHMIAVLIACVLDAIIGDPQGWPHPVRAIGALIDALDRKLNHALTQYIVSKKQKKILLRRGALTVIFVLLITALVTSILPILGYCLSFYIGLGIDALICCPIVAAKSLCKESMKVHEALERDDIKLARKRLSMIVGRDTEELDEPEILRAAVETVAENTSDGVIAPLFYTILLGPVGGMLYKAANTMDSMLGYHNDRYEYFGKAAARLDDVLNFLPSRLSALLMVASAALIDPGQRIYDAEGALRIWNRDRSRHASPNSAQTESACAGALGIALGGDATYRGVLVHKPQLGDATREIERVDIRRANVLMFVSEILLLLIFSIISVLLFFFFGGLL